jgi:hypothetical protein
VAHDGECDSPRSAPKVCGTIRGLPCGDGEYCDLRAGVCKGADLDGTCVVKPATCAPADAPVCACDGKTYANDCERIRAGIQKDHDGACRE